MTIKYLLLTPLAFAMLASAQRPDGGATCESGTPIPFADDGAWGYATPSGVIIPPQFRSAAGFSSGVATACTIESCGLIDTKGKVVTPLVDRQTNRFANRYSEGVGVFYMKDNKLGYADLSGNIVIPAKFEAAGVFDHGLARVKLDGKYFFIDHQGIRVTPEFDGVFDFGEDLAAVLIGDKVGYIRRDGQLALPPKYQGTSGTQFSEGLVAFSSEKKVGFMDHTGSIVIEPAYDDAYPFSEGRAPVQVGESWGYIDKSGKMVAPPQYMAAHMFNEGMASVLLAGSKKWGYIDHAGIFVIPPVFDRAMPFCAGLAKVETSRSIGAGPGEMSRSERFEGRHGLIDHSGTYVWQDPVDRVWRGVGW